jgi:hypothetical protein
MLSSSSVSIFLECAIFNSVYVIPAGRDFPRDLSAVPTDKVRPMSDILNDKWSVLLCTTVKRIIHLFLYNREGGGYLSVDGQQTSPSMSFFFTKSQKENKHKKRT